MTHTEEEISDIIKTSKLAYLMFQPQILSKEVTIGSVKTECDVSTEKQLQTTKYKKVESKLLDYLQKIKSEPHFLTTFITSHIQVIEAIEELQRLTPYVIHFNIHKDNILYDPTNAIPVITDFRMGLIETDLDQEYQYLIPEYEENPCWPFEIYLLSKLEAERFDERPEESLHEIKEHFMKSHNIPTKKETLDEYIKQFENKTKNEIIESIKTTAKSWDIYATAVTYDMLLDELQIPTEIEEIEKYKIYLQDCIKQNPLERDTSEKQKDEIKKIFETMTQKSIQDLHTKMKEQNEYTSYQAVVPRPLVPPAPVPSAPSAVPEEKEEPAPSAVPVPEEPSAVPEEKEEPAPSAVPVPEEPAPSAVPEEKEEEKPEEVIPSKY